MKKLKNILYYPGMMLSGMMVGNCIQHLAYEGLTDRIYVYGIIMSILFIIFSNVGE